MSEIDKLLETANQYWSNKEYPKANKIYEELIKLFQCPEAFFHLGYSYCVGEGIDKDYAKARVYLETALELGYTEARVYDNLGLVYAGENQNYTKAIELFKKALELDPNRWSAMFNLGQLYRKGLGVDKDYIKAINLYAKGYSIEKDDRFIWANKSFMKKDEIIKHVFEELAKVNELKIKVEKLEKLEKENEMLKAELMYQPGGEGYQAAKDEFNYLSKLKN